MPSDSTDHSKKSSPRNHLLNFTLRGLPELELFPTPDQRQGAIDQLGTEAGNPKSGQFWLGVVLVAGGALAARWLTGWLLGMVLWPRVVEEVLQLAGTLVGFLVVLRWLHRSGAANDLRKKLLDSGIPVCTHCGYLLRGLTPAIARCPECGTPFSPRVCELLAKTEPRP